MGTEDTTALAGRRRPPRRAGGATLGTALCAGALLAACGSSSSSASSAALKLTKAPFRIEFIGDLSGPDAEQNVPEEAGIKAWAQTVNATGGVAGHPIDITTCDAASSTTGAVTCAQQVPSDVGVVVEEGVAGELKAGPPILQGKGKLVLTDVPTTNPAPGSNLFQVSAPLASDMLADIALLKKNGITNIGVLTTSDATGQAVSGIFNAAAPKAGVKVEIQEIATSAVDATVQMSQLQADHAQALYVGTLGEPAVAAMQAAHTLNWSGPIFVLPADVTQTFIQTIKTSMPSALYGQPPSDYQLIPVLSGAPRAKFDQLEAAYKKVTGRAWDTNTQAPITAFLGSLAATVMQHLGAVPTLSQAESFLLKGTVSTPLGPIAFPSTKFQDGNLPAPLGEATASPLQWGPCTSSATLKTC
jgi:ABC-type branched-subunit amino acid transport system substrate-binding protein